MTITTSNSGFFCPRRLGTLSFFFFFDNTKTSFSVFPVDILVTRSPAHTRSAARDRDSNKSRCFLASSSSSLLCSFPLLVCLLLRLLSLLFTENDDGRIDEQWAFVIIIINSSRRALHVFSLLLFTRSFFTGLDEQHSESDKAGFNAIELRRSFNTCQHPLISLLDKTLTSMEHYLRQRIDCPPPGGTRTLMEEKDSIIKKQQDELIKLQMEIHKVQAERDHLLSLLSTEEKDKIEHQ